MARYRSYKFTDKHHSKGGIRSTIAGAVSYLFTFWAVYCAFSAKGNAGNYLAVFGVLAIAACGYGLVTGKNSFREEESYDIFSRLGTGLNLLLVIFWIAVTGLGYFLGF